VWIGNPNSFLIESYVKFGCGGSHLGFMIDIKNLGSMKFQAFGKNKNYFFLFPYVSRLRLCLIHGSGHL
jgi:hypothetical protein